MKKADISITTIIVAAIALIVLIVLIAIFTGRINLFGKTYNQETENTQLRVCNVGGGRCTTNDQCTGSNTFKPYADNARSIEWIDCSSNQGCCKPN